MIILLCSENRSHKERMENYFGKACYSIIQYSNPLKAMDNLEEICPRVFICNANDYPRHWKLIVKQLRDRWSREQTAVILSVGYDFDSDEAHKAAFLGVNALYYESLDNEENYHLLEKKILRYVSPKISESPQYMSNNSKGVNFIFRHPNEHRMISGHLATLSPLGGDFHPDEPADVYGMETGDLIEAGSMRASGKLFSINARITTCNHGIISMDFVDIDFHNNSSLIEASAISLSPSK